MNDLIDLLQDVREGSVSVKDAAKTIESQAREIERLKDCWQDCRANKEALANNAISLQSRIAALKAQSSVVVLPPSPYMPGVEPSQLSDYERGEAQGRCDMWAEVARLNQPASGGDDRETIRAVFLRNGFTIKEGQTDLKPYVYATASELISIARAAIPVREAVAEEWQLSADVLPETGRPVLAYYLNSHGMARRIRAMHVKRFTVEAEEFADPDTQCCEYSEQDDCYYTTEGWYELIDNWPDYSSCAVIEGVITHWMQLPAAPSPSREGE